MLCLFKHSAFTCGSGPPLFAVAENEITEELLAQYSAIHPSLDVDQEDRNQLKKLNLNAKAYQFDTRKTLILSGVYIGYLPFSYIQQEVQAGDIRIVHKNSYNFALSLAC